MEKCSLSQANKIRTRLLINTDKELQKQTPSQRIKINSITYEEMMQKYSKIIIYEKEIITSTPKLLSSQINFQSNNNLNKYKFPYKKHLTTFTSEIDSPTEMSSFLCKEKVTFSLRKLGLDAIDEHNSSQLIPCHNRCDEIDKKLKKQGRKVLQMIHRSLQHRSKKKKTMMKKRYSEWNVLQRQGHLESWKAFNKVAFEIDQHNRIVIREKEGDDQRNIIQLHRCGSIVHNDNDKREEGYNDSSGNHLNTLTNFTEESLSNTSS